MKKVYTKEWIGRRLLNIKIRNNLTAEWDSRGVKQSVEYAILKDEITNAWAGINTKEYKN